MQTFFRPLLISQRLPFILRSIKLKPIKLWMRVLQILSCNRIIPFISVAIVFSFLASCLLFVMDENELQLSVFFSMVFISVSDLMYQWINQRENVCTLLTECRVISRKIEVFCNEDQLRRMRRLTYVLRGAVLVVAVDAVAVISLYNLYLLQHGLVIVAPFLADNTVYTIVMYFLQSSVLTAAPCIYYTFYTFYFELCVYYATLFRMLGEHIRVSQTQENLNAIIGLHQSLLESSRTLEKLFSHLWADLMCYLTAMEIWISYQLLIESFEVFYIFLLVTILIFVYMPCALSELLSITCLSVGEQAYENAWPTLPIGLRKDLSFVILRSRKSTRVTAGLFGPLDLAKFQGFLKNWYTMVQALHNLMPV